MCDSDGDSFARTCTHGLTAILWVNVISLRGKTVFQQTSLLSLLISFFYVLPGCVF